MEASNTTKGYEIAKSIRKTLFRIDLSLTYAEAERRLAHEKYKLHSKETSKKGKKAAMRAKMRERCYQTYVDNVTGIREDVLGGVEWVLQRYTPKYRDVWVMYFLEQRTVEEMMDKLSYSKTSINRIIKQLKDDISEAYGDAWK